METLPAKCIEVAKPAAGHKSVTVLTNDHTYVISSTSEHVSYSEQDGALHIVFGDKAELVLQNATDAFEHNRILFEHNNTLTPANEMTSTADMAFMPTLSLAEALEAVDEPVAKFTHNAPEQLSGLIPEGSIDSLITPRHSAENIFLQDNAAMNQDAPDGFQLSQAEQGLRLDDLIDTTTAMLIEGQTANDELFMPEKLPSLRIDSKELLHMATAETFQQEDLSQDVMLQLWQTII